MSDDNKPTERAAVSFSTMEAAVALIIFALGVVVAIDSFRIGARWADDGPQAGYFPFYIGLCLCVTSVSIFLSALRHRSLSPEHMFVSVEQLRSILAVFVPLAFYVVLIRWIGIYAASIVLISFFMIRVGRFRWWAAALVSIGAVGMMFMTFEIWFKLPLPKGALEALFGFA